MKRINNQIMLSHERQQLDHVESWKNFFSQVLWKDMVVSLFYVRKLHRIYILKYYRDGEMVHQIEHMLCKLKSVRVLDPRRTYENLGVVAHTYNPSARKQILNGPRDSLVCQSIHLVTLMPLLLGHPPERLLCPWVGKGHRNEPLEMVSRNSV